MKIHMVEQGSDAWKSLRVGRMTGSNASAIATGGKGLETYIWKIMSDLHATEQVEVDSYTNAHMERGTRLEPQARSLYELLYNVKVDQVGFIEDESGFWGTSPDGLISDDTLIEIKCHDNPQHFKLLVRGAEAIDPSYIWQIQMNLLITRRKIAKYIAFNPNFKQSLLVFDVLPDPIAFEKLEAGLAKGTELIKSITSQLQNHE